MRKRWLLVPAGVLTIGGAALYSWWQSPASTTVAQTDRQNVNAVLGSETSLHSWQSKYFTTRYPATMRILTTSENDSRAIIGSYLLSSTDPSLADQVGITIGTLGNTTFDEISALKFRDLHPELFNRSNRDYAPAGAVVFDGLQAFETDVIWQVGDRYAVVAVTGSDTRHDELEQATRAIVANWRWR